MSESTFESNVTRARGSAMLRAIDAVEGLATVRNALMGLEELVEPRLNEPDSNVHVNRQNLYCLLALINTRMFLDLKEATEAVHMAAAENSGRGAGTA